VVRARFRVDRLWRVSSLDEEHSCCAGSYLHPHSVLCKDLAVDALRYDSNASLADVQAKGRVDYGANLTYKQGYVALKACTTADGDNKEASYG
jgi:hypothetical protein